MSLLSQAKLLYRNAAAIIVLADTSAPSAVSTIPFVNKPHVHVGHGRVCIYTTITQSSKHSKVKKVQNFAHWRFGQ